MRVALLILLGLVIGILGTANVMNTLAARNPMPRAVMQTMDYHMNALSRALKAKQCAATDMRQHLARVQSTATDIVPAFGIPDQASPMQRSSYRRALPRHCSRRLPTARRSRP